jgi:hypothetical protein
MLMKQSFSVYATVIVDIVKAQVKPKFARPELQVGEFEFDRIPILSPQRALAHDLVDTGNDVVRRSGIGMFPNK